MPYAFLKTSTTPVILTNKTLVEIFSHKTLVVTFLAYTAIQLLVYFLCTKFIFPKNFSTAKPRAWILSAMFAAISTVLSIGYTIELVQSDLSYNIYETFVSKVYGGIFSSFLILDLALGVFAYPSQIQLGTGWIHHTIYLLLMIEFDRRGIGPVMTPAGVMEIPTLLLAMGNIDKRFKTELGFGITYLLTRILFHAYYVVMLYRIMPTTLYWALMLMPFPMHVMWFRGWCKRQSRLAQSAKPNHKLE